jgi:hypothetical protein
MGITPKGKGNDGLAALMLCVVGFGVVGSYPKFSDNSKGGGLSLGRVKKRHRVKLRKEEKPEEGSSPVSVFSHEKWKETGEPAEKQTVPEAAWGWG